MARNEVQRQAAALAREQRRRTRRRVAALKRQARAERRVPWWKRKRVLAVAVVLPGLLGALCSLLAEGHWRTACALAQALFKAVIP